MDESQNLPDKTQCVRFQSRCAKIRIRLTGETPRNKKFSGVSGNQSGVSSEMSRSHAEVLRSSFTGVKRVHFPDGLLIPQN